MQATPAEATYFANLPSAANVLVVRLDKYGDFSPYTLQLVKDSAAAALGVFPITETLNGFDPQLASVTFSFKVDCGPDFDCAPAPPNCAVEPPAPPPINYLAKDYTTFRQVMLDRMNQLLPSWAASTEADIGVMLAEAVSYACDQLSYRQDAVTTEAYLNTARSRISLRRHARLVDYHISEGCNARAWIQVNVSATTFLRRHGTRFYTTAPDMPNTLAPGSGNENAAVDAGVTVFEPMQQALLFPAHNLMYFYTWGDANCCLPKGATEATLLGAFADLRVGDVLIFQEALGPQTGVPADADIRHRCAVRLTAVATTNAAGSPLVDPLFDVNGTVITSSAQQPQPVTEIQWSTDDALPFPVCISSTIAGSDDKETALPNVSVVLGNVILADNGLTMPASDLGVVPAPSLYYAPSPAAAQCGPRVKSPLPVRFRPILTMSPLTQAAPVPLTGSPSTPDAVPLSATSPVSLKDGDGFITLQAEADSPAAWPQYFGVLAAANATPGQFDLAIVFDPLPGGPAGMTGPVTLEHFVGMNSDERIAELRSNSARQLAVHRSELRSERDSPDELSLDADSAAEFRGPQSGGGRRHLPDGAADQSDRLAAALQHRVAAADRPSDALQPAAALHSALGPAGRNASGHCRAVPQPLARNNYGRDFFRIGPDLRQSLRG